MAETRTTGAAASEAWILMGQIWLSAKGRLHAAAAEFDLSPPQVMALRQLCSHKPCPMSELAAKLACDNSNVTGIVDRLEKRGLVDRQAATHDRRVKHLVLTADGARLQALICAQVDRAPEALEGLSEAEQRQLRDLLRRAVGDDA